MSDNNEKTLAERMADKSKITTSNGKIKFGAGSALHQRMAASVAKKQEAETLVGQLPNRVGLMLDVSGSMAGTKLQMCKAAAEAFLQNCDDQVGVAINTFEPSHVRIPLSTQHMLNNTSVATLTSLGGTPMTEAMQDMLHNEPLTRGIIISDGEANDSYSAIECAEEYKEAGIPIDCVHIGDSTGGEETLREIASITGGYYIKFTKLENFAQNFKYLTPRYRALLGSGNAGLLLGADEFRGNE